MSWALAAQAAPAVLGAVGGLMSDGGDKFMSMKDLYGGAWKGDMTNVRNDIFDLAPPGYFPDQTFAAMDPAYQQALLQGINYGQPGGFGYLTRQNMLGQGMMGMQGLQGLGGTAADIASGNFGQGIFDQTMGNLMPGLPGAFESATRDDTRQFFEQVMPGLDQNAAMTGNMASSRAGVAEGIAQRGYQDRLADVGSNLWMNAANQAQGAVMDSMNPALAGFQGMANLGLPGMGDALQTDLTSMNLMRGGGQAFMDQNQRRIDENIARWNDPYTSQVSNLNNIISLMNSTTPAGAGVNPMMTPGASGLERAVAGAEAGMGLWNAISPIFGTQTGSNFMDNSVRMGG